MNDDYSMEDEITVLYMPVFDGNPYHDLLFTAFEDIPVNPTRAPRPLPFPLTRAVLRNDSIDIIHLEWIFVFYMSTSFSSFRIVNAFLTVGRGVFFILDLACVKLLQRSIVWTVHNKYHHERHFQLLEQVIRIVVANSVDAICVKCDAAKQTVIDIYKIQNISKVTIIPDGNYIDAYPNEVTKKEAREYLDLGTEFVYLFFGRIRPYKGVNQLIDSFRQIQTGEEILYVAGSPSTSDIERDIRSSAGEDTQIRTDLKYIPDENIQYYMNAADVLVLPYQDILNSGSVYLGLSFGIPIIAPEIGCIPSIVPEDNDLLFNTCGSQHLTERMCDVKRSNLSDIREINYARAKYYTWDQSASQYYRLYSCELY